MKREPAVVVVHFADAWCWWSWGLEPVLRRLEEVYEDNLAVEYRMGGTFEQVGEWMKAYGVDEKSTVDWVKESVSTTGNPVDPEYFRKSGVQSTYPSARAFKAAQLQDAHKAARFFRAMMEEFQLRASPWSEEAAASLAAVVGLDAARLKRDMHSAQVEKQFQADMHEMHHEGVNFMQLLVRSGKRQATIEPSFAAKPFEDMIDRMAPGLSKRAPADILEYMEKHAGAHVTAREVAEVFRLEDMEASKRLEQLAGMGLLGEEALAGFRVWKFKVGAGDKLPLEAVRISHVPPEVQVDRVSDLAPIIKAAVQSLYRQVAEQPEKEYHFPLGMEALLHVGYPKADLERLPPEARESFAGVGYPFATNAIQPGDGVLDVGSGSGTDILFAALKVGPKGSVTGVDMTPEMIAKARKNIERQGAKNVKVVEGNATAIPVPTASVDVVTSNGVLNLVPDKDAAFAEIFRVLRPGGRLQLADIVVQQDVAAVCGLNPQLWADCIGGAAVEAKYLESIRAAGFKDVKVVRRDDYFAKSRSENTKRVTKTFGAESVVISARKPA